MEVDAFSEEARAQHEQQNNDIWINRFPTEIISRIFITGDQRYEIEDESVGSQYIPTVRPRRRPEFQEIIVQVCRAWRKVAIDTQMLWTFISLNSMKPKLRQRAITFLERSGSTIPLTVEIDITGRSSDHETALDHQSQTQLMQEHLVFLASHGGSPSRWYLLTVWLETSSAMFTVLEFLSIAALDNLRTLVVVNSSADSDLGDDTGTEVSRTNDLSQHIMFRTPPPALRLLELDGVTMDFFFSRMGTPLASNLTHLHLGPILSLPPLKNLHDLLVNTPQLQSLGLDVYMVQTEAFQLEDPGSIRLSLPNLRRILLREPYSVEWGMAFLRMIDAPRVEVLALSLNAASEFPYRIPQYIARGRVGGRLRNEIPGPRTNAGPIYPSLKELELGAYMGNPMSLETILASSAKITRLDWEVHEDLDLGVSIKALMSQTSSTVLCPRLERLKVTIVPEEDLIGVVRWRKNRGHPLKIVEVPTRLWAKISEKGKAVLTSELHEFRRYRDGTEPEGGWGGRGGEGSNDNPGDGTGDGTGN